MSDVLAPAVALLVPNLSSRAVGSGCRRPQAAATTRYLVQLNQNQGNTLLLLVLLVVFTGACARGSGSASDWTNESRVREDALKTEFNGDFADVPAHLLSMAIETRFPSGDGGPRRPSAAAPIQNGLALIVENNSGRVFIGQGRQTRELALEDGLVFPSPLRADDGRFYVSDNDGLKSFDYAGQLQMLVRTFLTIHDFAFLTPDAVAVNPRMARPDAPVVALVTVPGGIMTKTWGSDRRTLVPGPKTAHLASCDQKIVVGLAYEPLLIVLDASLESEVVIELPFPKKAQLLSLSADERMVSPAPGVVTAPTFVAGVACVEESSYFVLLDLPWLCILEYDFPDRLVAIHYADNVRPNRHYRRLNARKETNGIRFITVAEDGMGPGTVVEGVAKARHNE